MGTASGPDFLSTTEVAHRCVYCGTYVTVRIYPLLRSVELEVRGNFCDRCSHLTSASIQPVRPEQFRPTAPAHDFPPRAGAAEPKVTGELVGVELRWVKSTPTDGAHFRETFFGPTAETASRGPGSGPGEPTDKGSARNGELADDHSREVGGADSRRCGPDKDGNGEQPPQSQGATGDSGRDGEHKSSRPGGAAGGHGSHEGPGGDADGAQPPNGKEEPDHRQEAAETAVDLFESGLKEHLADQLAERLGDEAFEIIDAIWTPEHCEMLAALADKLDQLHSLIRNGIAAGVRIVVRWAGASDFTAALIGELVASAVDAHFLYPLTGIATMLRVTGAVCCTACGCAGDCACARGLAKDLFTRYLKWLFGVEIDRLPLSVPADKIVGPGIYVTYEYFKNRDDDDAHQEPPTDGWEFWGPGWRPTSSAWFWDFPNDPTGSDDPASRPWPGPSDDAPPTGGSRPADPGRRNGHDEDLAASASGTEHAAAGATAGSISALAGMTKGGPSEPPTVAGFGCS
jgi:hypothetical protein